MVKLKIALAAQVLTLALLVTPSYATGTRPACTSGNVDEIWCSECYQSGPHPTYEFNKYECKDKGEGVFRWEWIDGYEGPDSECDGKAAECEGGPGGQN